jgi:hypothetical protein
MKSLLMFMSSKNGRIARIVVGALLLVLGFAVVDIPWGYLVMAIGVIPLVAGLLDKCLLAAAFGYPINGPDLRKKLYS